MRKAVGKHLKYAKRDLKIIKELIMQSLLSLLNKQEEMYHTKSQHVDHRIVSVSQPHVRLIV